MASFRLCRVRGRYWMHLGVGRSIEVTDEIVARRKWGREWPTVVIDLGVSTDAFARVAASNHYVLVPGYHSREIRYTCFEAGIPILRIDSAEGIEEAVSAMTGD